MGSTWSCGQNSVKTHISIMEKMKKLFKEIDVGKEKQKPIKRRCELTAKEVAVENSVKQHFNLPYFSAIEVLPFFLSLKNERKDELLEQAKQYSFAHLSVLIVAIGLYQVERRKLLNEI